MKQSHYLDDVLSKYKGSDKLFVAAEVPLDVPETTECVKAGRGLWHWYICDEEDAVILKLKYANLYWYTYDLMYAEVVESVAEHDGVI